MREIHTYGFWEEFASTVIGQEGQVDLRMNSKTMKIASCLVTIVLIILGIQSLGYIVRPTDTDRTYRRIQTFHALPEESVEVIIYGSSHAFLGVNTMELYNKYGIGAYNYGANYQKSNTVNLFLHDSFETQTPKLAIIDTFFADRLLKDTNVTAEVFYTRYLDNSAQKKRYLKQCFGNNIKRWLSYFIPLYAFHENWNTLNQVSFMPLATSGNGDSLQMIRSNMGYAPYDTVTKIKIPDSSAAEQTELSEEAVAELDDIVAACREEGTEILFVTIPYDTAYPNADAMAEYARANGYEYLNLFDYSEEMGLNGETDFKDKGHLNKSGATKVADFIGRFIVDHYDLTDMRKEENNLWEQALNN